MGGQRAVGRLSGMNGAADLRHMHGLYTMLRFFSPAAVGTGVEMGHQTIQHVEHAFRKHRTLTLFALTHPNPPIAKAILHHKASSRLFQGSCQVFLSFLLLDKVNKSTGSMSLNINHNIWRYGVACANEKISRLTSELKDG